MFKSWIKHYQNLSEKLLKLSHEFKKSNANPAEQQKQKHVNKLKSETQEYAYTIKNQAYADSVEKIFVKFYLNYL